jgi:exopolyphosphatase/guanosine-5'-triphosphate,3'-diphosphate pyrophosphatase
VAAIDCGTNSIRLLVADVDPATGRLVDVLRRMEVVRLGEGVDRTGRLSDAALARTFAATEDYAADLTRLGAHSVRFVATSASRDAANRADFVAGVRARIGVEPEVVTGAQEARLSFDGATREIAGPAPGPYLVLDIGGGSTEVVLGASRPEAALSIDVGCVRLTERHLRSDPPTAEEVGAARADVRAALDRVEATVPIGEAGTVVGLAGSVTTVAAIALGLSRYDPSAIHLSSIATTQVHAITARLLAMGRAERAALPVMHPGRVDVIGGGALVLDVIMERVGQLAGLDRLLVSEHDILDGIAWSQVAG